MRRLKEEILRRDRAFGNPSREALPPHPDGRGILEFLTLNAGEGAFHWVRCHHADACSGWIYDCGTRSGKDQMDRSIRAVANSISRPLAKLIISHYHSDHVSHLRELRNALRNVSPVFHMSNNGRSPIWIPKIDAYSMSLYLRLLTFSTFFKNRDAAIVDRDLNKIFSKPGHLAQDLSRLFDIPRDQILSAGSGDADICPMGKESIGLKALTPPHFPRGESHPLADEAGSISYLLSDSKFEQNVEAVAKAMLDAASRENSGLWDYLDEVWGPDNTHMLSDLIEKVMFAIKNPPLGKEGPSDEQLHGANKRLHMWLSVSLFAPEKSAPRLSISGKDAVAPRPFRKTLLAIPEKIRDATHLFNLVVEFSDGRTSYLLTGDADVRLWPEILRGCSRAQEAIQAPHHGSRENVPPFHVFKEVQSGVFIVSAGKFKNWSHPSTKLGAALAGEGKGQGSALYCTNVHPNCEMLRKMGMCRTRLAAPIQAISVTPGNVDWIIEGRRVPAERCPEV
jgi:hypothetical protein